MARTPAASRIAAYAVRQWREPIRDGRGAAAARVAYRALLDTLAVAIAGQREDATRIVRASTRELAGAGDAVDWGTGTRLPAETAALVNGVAAHVLDYDDVMTPMRAHVSATLVPALAALAARTGASGQRYADAFTAGFEVMAKFTPVMALDHYSKGWHSTSALGILGTTAACGVLLRLDEAQLCDALGLAVAQASGSRENFGAMAKSFQSAHAAASSVRAALLAQAGFTASANAIDGPYGYMKLYAGGEDLDAALASLGEGEPEILRIGLDLKKYPCCYALHRALDGAFDIRRASAVQPQEIERFDILTSAGGLQALRREPPRTGLEAKFSMEVGIAMALLDGRIGLDSFSDAAVQRQDVARLAARVSVTEAPGAILPRWSDITIRTRAGAVHQRRVAVAHGDAPDPLTDRELVDKAVDCFAWAGWPGDASAFAASVLALGERPLAEAICSCCALAP
jgi:2-methylcitrate dehydratase PrpD